MCIIVSTSLPQTSDAPDGGQQERLDPNLRALLDHVAAELATEYIRLMEAAAEADPEPAAATSA
jgi:hypothetical protein